MANDANSDLIYHKLLENNGALPVSDRSTPREIQDLFGISKKAFKKSIGALYKQNKIIIYPDEIKLVNDNIS
jgi:predicted RNA-binding protein (virulence factor B family)